MPSPSSTSSSDKTTLLVAAMVAGVFLFGLSLATERVNQATSKDRVAERLHVWQAAQPRLLILGSSLLQSWIIPSQLAKALDMPEEDVVSAAAPGFGIWQVEAILDRITWNADGALVLFEITPAMFNSEQYNPVAQEPFRPTEEVYRWADVNQMAEYDGVLPTTVARTLLPVLRLRRPLDAWVVFARDLNKPNPTRSPTSPYHVTDTTVLEKHRNYKPFQPAEVSRWSHRNYTHSEERFARLIRLVERLEAANSRVILVVPQVHPTYYAYVQADPERARQFALTHAALTSLRPSREVIFLDPTASGANPDELFLDYGHMTEAGARRTSQQLADILRVQGQVPTGPSH